jgi:hypothetical protein
VAEGAGQLAEHGVGDDHRRELAAGQHVGADRDRIVGEMLADALVDALVAAAEQGEMRLGRELGDQVVVEPPPRGAEHDHPGAGRCVAVRRAQRRVDDVDAKHHPGSAAVGSVIHLAARQRRGLAIVKEAELRAPLDRVSHVALAEEPVKPLREQREHVDPHSSKLAGSPGGADAGAEGQCPSRRRGQVFERERSSRRECL